jgi:hypothetical protein
MAAYNVGYRLVGLKRIVGAVGAIAALSIAAVIISLGELLQFCLTFLLVVAIAISLGVAARRIHRPVFATPTEVQRPAVRASLRATVIDRLLQGNTVEAVSQEFSLPPEDILEWRSQLVQSIEQTDRTPSRESFWSRLGYWPAVAALLGLVLYVPTYIAYEYFYGHLGISPDEVGLNYANVLSRETTWLVSSILVVSAALGALVLCLVAAAHPQALGVH